MLYISASCIIDFMSLLPVVIVLELICCIYVFRENDSDESSEDESTHREEVLCAEKHHIMGESLPSVTSQLITPNTQVQYVETLTFDPSTGLYTTSRTPTIIETDASYILQAAEPTGDAPVANQVVVINESKDKTDPDYVDNKINYLKSGKRSSRISLTSRRSVHHGSKNICNRCGRTFANVSLVYQEHLCTS